MTSPSAPTNPGSAASPDNPSAGTSTRAGASEGTGAGTASSASSGTSPVDAGDGPIGKDLTGDGPLSPEEAADRKAAEDVWLQYNELSLDLWDQPTDTWKQSLSRYAKGDIITRAVNGTRELIANGKGNWGRPAHHLYWQSNIDGQQRAILGDCIDARQMGTLDSSTGERLTVGVQHDNAEVSLVREAHADWKVLSVTFLEEVPCPGVSTSWRDEVDAAQTSENAKSVEPTS